MNTRLKLMSSALLAFTFLINASAASLTSYITEWAGYGAEQGAAGYPAYPVDGSYPNAYHNNTVLQNADMLSKAQDNAVLAYAFVQVWDPNSAQAKKFNIPAAWAGHIHFDDLWANLPNATLTNKHSRWLNFCNNVSAGGCSAIQMSGVTHQNELMDYKTDDVGQMNNFGAFVSLPTNQNTHYKIISIGGANLITNHAVAYDSFQTIFSNQTAFLTSLGTWITQLKTLDPKFNGIDYDFEPPINPQTGAQLPPNAQTTQDYQHLYQLVIATRKLLGKTAYISITLTPNEAYLKAINSAVAGGFFKSIAPYVNSVNVMTYDMHGPWSQQSDPGTLPHALLQQPKNLAHQYTINYAAEDVANLLLTDYGLPADKLALGLASYGRGFSGVAPGSNSTYPGLDQTWSGASSFKDAYTNGQAGMLPYKFIKAIMQDDPTYKSYELTNAAGAVIGSYIYSPSAKQFVGYESSAEVASLCQYMRSKGIEGAILWSMDTDANNDGSQGSSLTQAFHKDCMA